MKISEVNSALSTLRHPKYPKAVIDSEVIWLYTCPTCLTVHKIGTDTVELDFCCAKQYFP